MLEQLFKLFGDNLPDRNIFFATKGAPTRAVLRLEFGDWVTFNNEYKRYVAKQKAEATKVVVEKPTPKPAKGAVNAK